MKRILFVTIAFVLIAAALLHGEDHIIYVAHQDWLSRIYILRMNGSVVNYYEYSYYYFCDVEEVGGEIHVAEAFAPESFIFDPYTGNITPVINDISLYYFYDLAFDGTYFYVTEWNLNRYDINGNKDGSASFDEDVMGGAWDGVYYWTLNDTNEIKCWDLSGWPTVTEVPANNFAPPTAACRGLWFDGAYFWTAENFDGYLGNIYQFDYDGTVMAQWTEPAYRGWAACVVDLVGVEESDAGFQRQEFRITASPNPFSSSTTLHLSGIGHRAEGMALEVYDASGRRVRKISLPTTYSLLHTGIIWDGRDEAGERLPPGVYLVIVQSGTFSASKKVVLLK